MYRLTCTPISCNRRILLAVWGVLTAFIAVAALAPPARAQAGLSTLFGSVDVQKVIAGYNKKTASDAQMKALADQLDNVYKTQAMNDMLSQDQQNQLGTLLLKDNPTSADQAQIQLLEQQSQRDAQALTTLQQQKDLTDSDKTQLTQLTTEQQLGQQALQGLQDDYRNRLDQENQQLSQQIADDIKNAVGAVAKQKGLAVVFDSQVAIYTANDITQAVINKLNSK